jgi:hypothetical protein
MMILTIVGCSSTPKDSSTPDWTPTLANINGSLGGTSPNESLTGNILSPELQAANPEIPAQTPTLTPNTPLTTGTPPVSLSLPSNSDEAYRLIFRTFSPGIILEGSRLYIVQYGDTLSQIALQNYGNSRYFPLIAAASSNVVTDPELIMLDSTLTVPDLQRNLDNSAARQNLKSLLKETARVYSNRGVYYDTAQTISNLADSL